MSKNTDKELKNGFVLFTIEYRKIKSRRFMKFDTLSKIKEILPYYGWLDDSCRLLKMVNKKANEIWSNSYYRMSKRFKRKNVMINAENRNQLVEYQLSNQLILTLFKSEILEIDTKDKYEWFIELL